MNTTLKIAAASLLATTISQSAENNNQRINPLEQSICMDENFQPISERDIDRLMAQTKADYEDLEMQKILDQSRKDHEQLEKKKAIELSLAKKEKKDRQEIYQQIEIHEINELLEMYHLNELFEAEEKEKQFESDELMALSLSNQSCFFPLELQNHEIVHTNNSPNLEKSINIESIYEDAGRFLTSLRNEIEKKPEYFIYLETLKELKDCKESLSLAKEQLEDLPEKLGELNTLRILLIETKIPYSDILKHNGLLNGKQKFIIDDEISKNKYKKDKFDINNVDIQFISGIMAEYDNQINSLPIEIQFITQRRNNLKNTKNSPEYKNAFAGIDKEYDAINKIKALSEQFKISDKKAQDILDIFGL